MSTGVLIMPQMLIQNTNSSHPQSTYSQEGNVTFKEMLTKTGPMDNVSPGNMRNAQEELENNEIDDNFLHQLLGKLMEYVKELKMDKASISEVTLEQFVQRILEESISDEQLIEHGEFLIPVMAEKLMEFLEQLGETEEYSNFALLDLLPVMKNPENINFDRKFQQLLLKFDSLLEQIITIEDMKQAAPKIISLLQQWQNLDRQFAGNAVSFLQEDTKAHLILKDLLQFYQKREQLAGRQFYQLEAKVTNQDIVKILEKAMERYSLKETSQSSNASFQSGTPLGKLEQYVIHLQQSNSQAGVDRQLLEQFQRIIQSSKFQSQPNGVNQLSIRLQPENLGNMMVRLIQVDGEMLVKITVTTQMAKDMLERNMNQLKHMFSPQQVVVEKQEIQMTEGQSLNKEQEEQTDEGFQQQSNKQGNDHDDDQQDNGETSFWEILNEKV